MKIEIPVNKKLIRITERGEKGSWWNKYVDNFFMANRVGDKYIIKYLCDNSGLRSSDIGKDRTIPIDYCRIALNYE